MPKRAAITGVGITTTSSPNRETRSRVELDQIAVAETLEMASCRRVDVDAIVVGNIDAFEGNVVAGRRAAVELGLSGVTPTVIVNTGGTTGGNLVHLGANMVRSGRCRRVLCVGSSTFFGVRDLQAVINTNSPMVVEQPLGMGAVHMGAFLPSAYVERFGVDAAALAEPAVRCHAHAKHNPFAHHRHELDPEVILDSEELSSPLRLNMVCPVSTGSVAVLIEDEAIPRVAGRSAAVIRAVGSSADTYLGGGRRDFSEMSNLALLARRVYRLAGIVDPRDDLDLVELFAPYAPMLSMQLEALGIAPLGGGADFLSSGEADFGGTLPVNLSGGPKCTNPGVAGELAPYAYVALQLMGRAPEELQLGQPQRGLAHTTGGTFFQFETLAVMEALARRS